MRAASPCNTYSTLECSHPWTVQTSANEDVITEVVELQPRWYRTRIGSSQLRVLMRSALLFSTWSPSTDAVLWMAVALTCCRWSKFYMWGFVKRAPQVWDNRHAIQKRENQIWDTVVIPICYLKMYLRLWRDHCIYAVRHYQRSRGKSSSRCNSGRWQHVRVYLQEYCTVLYCTAACLDMDGGHSDHLL